MTACHGLERIRGALVVATGEWGRFGREFAHDLRRGAQKYTLSDHDMQLIFEREIVSEHLEFPEYGRMASEPPILTVVLGQPGAGKSVAIRAIAASSGDRGGAIRLIADEYMRHHPAFPELRFRDDFTAGDHIYPTAERWLDMAIDYVITQRRHAVLEEGAGNPLRTARLIRRFQKNGYTSVVDALAVRRAESGASVLARFLHERLRDGTGRYVPVSAQNICFDGSAELLRLLESDRPPVAVDELRVRSRSEVLFENHRTASGLWDRQPEGRRVLQEERHRPLTSDEACTYVERTERFRRTVAHALFDDPAQAAGFHRLLIEMDDVSRQMVFRDSTCAATAVANSPK